MSTLLAAPARITAEPDGRGGTALPVLVTGGPLAPRRTRGEGAAAHVVLVGSMAAPLGGDRLAVHTEVRPGARLKVTSAAATISLPGPGPARYDVDLTVGEGAWLDWLPEPVVAATGSHLLLHTRITLAAGARLRYREEQVLGRHHDWARGAHPAGSPPGSPCAGPAGSCSTSRPTSAPEPPAGTAPPCSRATARAASCSPSGTPPAPAPPRRTAPPCSYCPVRRPSC